MRIWDAAGHLCMSSLTASERKYRFQCLQTSCVNGRTSWAELANKELVASREHDIFYSCSGVNWSEVKKRKKSWILSGNAFRRSTSEFSTTGPETAHSINQFGLKARSASRIKVMPPFVYQSITEQQGWCDFLMDVVRFTSSLLASSFWLQ